MQFYKVKRVYKVVKGKKVTTIKNLVNKSGVYAIYKNGKLVYIGHSQKNLYKTILRHFQVWNDRQRKGGEAFERVVYDWTVCAVKIALTTPARAYAVERALILKIKPKDNPLKYEQYQPTRITKEAAEAVEVAFNGQNLEDLEDAPF